MSQSDDEEILTAVDILEEEKNFEDEASALFGQFDNDMCTYNNDSNKRQPLYSCLSCREKTEEDAGICLACSLNCHDGHNLVELYTKRNFLCDCGNQKFKDKCKLLEKIDLNTQNIYNQNFQGLYCICKKPYPDPESEVEEEMIQCLICEDWFHVNHLNCDLPSFNFEEFICITCATKYPFLYHYKNESNILSNEICKIKNLDVRTDNEPLFFPNAKWREIICKCSDCQNLYKENNLFFITDYEDTLEYFTSKNSNLKTDFSNVLDDKKSTCSEKSQYESSLEAFSKLDKLSQNEMLHKFNEMSDNLKDYLREFAEMGKIVKKEDIEKFFEKKIKRQKTNDF